MASSSSTTSGVPPGFRFHPTNEELLLYYLKKKVSFEKFDLEVIREVDLNKMEPWDLQDTCRIGSTPQDEWYCFSHKDRKYPTGSRTNRATNYGFWKATGRDKMIKNSYKKIGMRKTLVFYRGRAPHGQKTDWIMHEFRLEEADHTEEGWVVCRIFKKKCLFKVGSEGSEEKNTITALASHDPSQPAPCTHQQQNLHHPHQYQATTTNLFKPELAPLPYSSHMPMHTNYYTNVQAQDLLPNHRPSSYDYLVLPGDSSNMVKPYQACQVEPNPNDWAVLDTMEGRLRASMQQMDQVHNQCGAEMDLWGYGK